MRIEERRFREIIKGFPRARIGVLGDLVADKYIFGKPYKLSREAPVLVIKHDWEVIVPGGAGNAINNLLSLGATVLPVGIVGDDEFGKFLLSFFRKRDVNISGIFPVPGRETVSKTRIMAGDDHTSKQQVIRIDKEPASPIDPEWELKILTYLKKICRQLQGLIVSDYGYGLFSESTKNFIRELAEEIPVVVDSRYRLGEFLGVTAITPNESEAEACSGIKIREEDDVITIGKTLCERLRLKAVLITRGNKGMVLVHNKNQVEMIPIYGSDEVTDVTGAGDTVTSVFTLSLVAGASFFEAAKLSNYAGGMVVMKRGAATVTPEELLGAIRNNLKENKG